MPGFDPAVKPLEDRIPVTRLLWQVTPLRAGPYDPGYGFQEQVQVSAGLAGICRFSMAVRFDARQLSLALKEMDQGCIPLFATLKHKSADL